MTVQVWLDDQPAAEVTVGPDGALAGLRYRPEWSAGLRAYPLSPRLPMHRAAAHLAAPSDANSAALAAYLNALRPGGPAEAGLGRALGRAAGDALRSVLIAAGDDLPGAVSLRDTRGSRPSGPQLRVIPQAEMAERLRGPAEASLLLAARDAPQVLPWWPSGSAGRPRVGVYLDQDQWWWTRTPQLSSTHLLEGPHPGEGAGAGERRLFNRCFCLRLAGRLGLDVAPVELLRLPMPVLQFQRWDRRRMEDGRVQRLHGVSVAQALGLPPHSFADPGLAAAAGVSARSTAKGVPTASGIEIWKQLGALLDLSPQPLVDRRALIRWWIFQTLSGHQGARPDELWCYLDHTGLRWAPVMDLICPPALSDATNAAETAGKRLSHLSSHLSSHMPTGGPSGVPGKVRSHMPGDVPGQEVSEMPSHEASMVPACAGAHDWAMAAKSCGAQPRSLANELRRMCEAAPMEAEALAKALADEVPQEVMQGIVTVVSENAARHVAWVDDLLHTDHRE